MIRSSSSGGLPGEKAAAKAKAKACMTACGRRSTIMPSLRWSSGVNSARWNGDYVVHEGSTGQLKHSSSAVQFPKVSTG